MAEAIGKNTFVGRAFCSVAPDNPAFHRGMRGAYVTIASAADSIEVAVQLIISELLENKLEVMGFDYLYDIRYSEGVSSVYETSLISKLNLHPVQFENVHFFKPDS